MLTALWFAVQAIAQLVKRLLPPHGRLNRLGISRLGISGVPFCLERTFVPIWSIPPRDLASQALPASDAGIAVRGAALGRFSACLGLVGFTCSFLCRGLDVTTYKYDNFRTGVNSNETILTPSNVNSSSFGLLFRHVVDGQIYAQPLILQNVSFGANGVHNAVYVATEHNSVYAFDADNADGSNAQPLWWANFNNLSAGITPVPPSDVSTYTPVISPEYGITSTPVIDPDTQTIYVEVATEENGVFFQRLHALSAGTGLEKPNSPVKISGGVSGTSPDAVGGVLSFDPKIHVCRPAMTLFNCPSYGGKVVLVAIGSYADWGHYHGWLFAYDAATLRQIGVWCSSPNAVNGSAIWQSGTGVSIDSNSNLYVATGNGTYNQSQGNYGDSVVKLTLDKSGFHVVDWFTPFNQTSLNNNDLDLGTGVGLPLPDSVGSTAHPHLLAQPGKEGKLYLLDRDSLGHFSATGDTQIVQSWYSATNVGSYPANNGTPTFFNGRLYVTPLGDYIRAFPLSNGIANTTPILVSPTKLSSGMPPVISANNTSNGIVWLIDNSGLGLQKPAVLHAYDAQAVPSELYNSSQSGARDAMGIPVKNSLPVIANGKVYAGTSSELDVFGNASWTATPSISPNGGTYSKPVSVTLSDATSGASIYYTTDGTTPTTNSSLYSKPLTISNSIPLSVRAFAPGKLPGAVATANFVSSTLLGSGVGVTGAYWFNQSGTFNGNPNLTRVDAQIAYNADPGSPGPYTVQWTGSLQPQVSGVHTIYLKVYGAIRFWFNGQQLVNSWYNGVQPLYTIQANLIAGQKYPIIFQHYQGVGTATALMEWSSPAVSESTVPSTQLYLPSVAASPTVALSSTPANAQAAPATVTLNVTATNPVAPISRVEFYLDGALTATELTSPYSLTLTGLNAGSHSVFASAADTNGNLGFSSTNTIVVQPSTGSSYGMDSRPTLLAYLGLPASPSSPMPALLSLTGVFTNLTGFGLNSGLIPFKPAAPFWSDGSIKSRWFGIPYGGGSSMPANQISYSQDGNWDFPVGSIFVKHFDLQTNQVLGSTPRRLETRLLAYDGNGGVHGATYRWRADGSDADLVTSAQTETISLTTTNGTQTQTWYYPSQTDCLTCHNTVAGGVLGASKMRQQNFSELYPQSGVTDNQLRVLNHLGMLNPALDETTISSLPHYAAASDTNSSLELRARSFLDVNCSYCHQPGGAGRAAFDLRITTALTNANLINGGVAATFGLPNAAAVVPGNPLSSTVYYRVDTATPGIMMPPLARSIIDQADQSILGKWIYSLASTNSTVVGRYLYDNNSAMDGSNPAANYSDDLAILSDKSALLPGGVVATSNYTTYSQGLDGILIDVSTLPGTGNLSTADFDFSISTFNPTTDNESSPSAWSPAPAPSGMSVRVGDGIGGSDRVDFAWTQGAINGQWLRVTVLATTNTGLASPDVFYFGTAPKTVPQIVTLPSASSITYGQSLLASTLSGGIATTPGTFSFSDVSPVPNAGSYLATVTFVPSDTGNYTSTTFQVPLMVNPAPATVTVSGPSNFNYNGFGQGPNSAVVTGSTATAVFYYSSADGTTYPASTAAPTNVGTYTVTASVSGDPNHLDAVSAPLSFQINPIPLTVTANNLTKTFGTSLIFGAGSTGFSAIGLIGSDVINSVTITASGGTQTNSPVGTYTLIPSAPFGPSFSAGNYSISYINGQLSVLPLFQGPFSIGPEVPLLDPWGIAILLSGFVGIAMRAARRSD